MEPSNDLARMEQDEQDIFNCAYCGVPILTWWDAQGRGMLRGEYFLGGDLVFHPRCWDEHVVPLAELT